MLSIPKPEQQMAELGVVIHSVLMTLHLVGVAYNLRRKNWLDVVAHGLATGYDAWAITKHIKHVKQCRCK